MTTDVRTHLIDQALRLFAERGYDAVSVQEIVDAAGVTKPSLYHYFGSKHGLLHALLQERTAALRDAVCQAARFENNLVMNLRDLASAFFIFACRQPAVYQFLMSSQYAPHGSAAFQAAAEYYEGLYTPVVRLFEQALPHMQGRHRSYAVTFIGMVNTYITLALNGYLELDEALMRTAVHQYMHGIFS